MYKYVKLNRWQLISSLCCCSLFALISVLPCVLPCVCVRILITKAVKSPEVIYFDDFEFNFTIMLRFYISFSHSFRLHCHIFCNPSQTTNQRRQRRRKNGEKSEKNLFFSLDYFRRFAITLNKYVEVTGASYPVRTNEVFTSILVGNKNTRKLNSFRRQGRAYSSPPTTSHYEIKVY